jgi:acyl-CoA thioesterase YciA
MITTHLVMPQDLNPFGSLFGGTMMGWMDVGAALKAFEVTHHNCVTAKVSEINFKEPVKLGDVVEILAVVVTTGKKSITIGIEAFRKGLADKSCQSVATATFVFVAVDKDGRSVKWWD